MDSSIGKILSAILVVLALVGVAVYAVVGVADHQQNTAVAEVATMAANIRGDYANNPSGYATLSSRVAATAGDVPATMLQNGQIISPWGTTVTVSSISGISKDFEIDLGAIPEKACVELLASDAGLMGATVQGSTIKVPVDPAAAVALCHPTSGTTVDVALAYGRVKIASGAKLLAAAPSSACSSLLSQAQASAAPNTICSCADPSSITELPSCEPDCSALLATSTYQDTSSQVCTCPSGGNTLTTPSCAPTCGAQLSQAQSSAGSNYVCSCPNGSTSAGFPSCLQTCSSQLTQAQSSAGSGYVCACPNGASSTQAPTCTPTCATQLPQAQSAAGSGYVCSCPNGSSSTSAPSCVPTCGTQLPQAQSSAGSNYVCSCPSGTSSLSAPSCTADCSGLLSQYQASYPGDTCSCPSGGSSLTNPTCCHTVNGGYFGVENWQRTPLSSYPTNFTSQQAACSAVAQKEAAAGYTQYSNLTWNGVGCYDGNSGDAVGGYPAYPYQTGSWSQQVCP